MKQRNDKVELYVSDLRGRSNNANNLAKYDRNFRYYEGTLGTSTRSIRNAPPLGMNYIDESVEWDTSVSPNENIIRSVIDTLVAKMSELKIRPFFNPIKGNYKTRKIVKQMQIFFDDYFEKQNILNKVNYETFRNALIFDTGYVFINPWSLSLHTIKPTEIAYYGAEDHYGDITKVMLSFRDFPGSLIEKWTMLKAPKDDKFFYNVELYFDSDEKEYRIYIDQKLERKGHWVKPVPIVKLHYSNPVIGGKSTSIVDLLFPMQKNLNKLNALIKECAQLNPASLYFAPEGTNITPQSLDNRVGNMIVYRPIPGVTTPIISTHQEFISEQYIKEREYIKKSMFELVGISQLSAMANKPAGLDSGVALRSMENIEADRFGVLVNNIIRCYIDISRLMIEIFPEDAELLPTDISRAKIQWKDVIEQSRQIKIQYSAATLFSRDPAEKLQQIMQYSQAGLINPARVGQLIELPDLEEANALNTAAIDAVDQTVEKAIETGIPEIPKFVSYDLLKKQIATEQNKIYGTSDDVDALTNLDMLDKKLFDTMIKEGFVAVDTSTVNNSEMIGGTGITEAPTEMNDVHLAPDANADPEAGVETALTEGGA